MQAFRWRIGLACVLLGAAAVVVIGYWRSSVAPLPNLLLITLDTTRADRIGAYGYASGLTPVLDQLAAEGVLFERAYSPAPLTLPLHASLMTGLYPPEHGLRTNGAGSGVVRAHDGRVFRTLTILAEDSRECMAIGLAPRLTKEKVLERLSDSICQAGRMRGKGSENSPKLPTPSAVGPEVGCGSFGPVYSGHAKTATRQP